MATSIRTLIHSTVAASVALCWLGAVQALEPVIGIGRAPAAGKRTLEVPSLRAGIVQLVGVPLNAEEVDAVDPEQRKTLLRARAWSKAHLAYLVVEESNPELFPEEQRLQFADAPGKHFRPRSSPELLVPGEARVGLIETTFRKLKVGDRVEEGQLLGLIDPKLAVDELEIKLVQFERAEAKRRAAEKNRDEAKKRYEAIIQARRLVCWILRR